MRKINQDWFKERLVELKLSQRQLAKRMKIDPASMSNMLAGKRSMTMDEARKIAAHFLLPVTEVMRQAGIDVHDDVRKVPIAGYVSSGGLVTLLPTGTHDEVVAPADVPAGGYAVQVRIVNNVRDGWLYFVSGQHVEPSEAMDKLCLVALKDGTLLHAMIKRGYKKGAFNLLLTGEESGKVMENKELAWASRTLWIQPI